MTSLKAIAFQHRLSTQQDRSLCRQRRRRRSSGWRHRRSSRQSYSISACRIWTDVLSFSDWRASAESLSAWGHRVEQGPRPQCRCRRHIEKPFARAELLARLRVALRRTATNPNIERMSSASGPSPSTGPPAWCACKARRLLHLTRREWDLLVMLARDSGRVVTQRHLLSAVWGPPHVGDA